MTFLKPKPARRSSRAANRPLRQAADRQVCRRSLRGNVALEFTLLAFALAVAGLLLVKVHGAFALLIPLAVLVFFLPKTLELVDRLRVGRSFRRDLAAAENRAGGEVTVLRNGLRGCDAQAVLLDLRRREVTHIQGDGAALTVGWDALVRVRAVRVGESFACSFHKGEIRIPPRYLLMFEFDGQPPLQLVTLKRRTLDRWLDSAGPLLGDCLTVETGER